MASRSSEKSKEKVSGNEELTSDRRTNGINVFPTTPELGNIYSGRQFDVEKGRYADLRVIRKPTFEDQKRAVEVPNGQDIEANMFPSMPKPFPVFPERERRVPLTYGRSVSNLRVIRKPIEGVVSMSPRGTPAIQSDSRSSGMIREIRRVSGRDSIIERIKEGKEKESLRTVRKPAYRVDMLSPRGVAATPVKILSPGMPRATLTDTEWLSSDEIDEMEWFSPSSLTEKPHLRMVRKPSFKVEVPSPRRVTATPTTDISPGIPRVTLTDSEWLSRDENDAMECFAPSSMPKNSQWNSPASPRYVQREAATVDGKIKGTAIPDSEAYDDALNEENSSNDCLEDALGVREEEGEINDRFDVRPSSRGMTGLYTSERGDGSLHEKLNATEGQLVKNKREEELVRSVKRSKVNGKGIISSEKGVVDRDSSVTSSDEEVTEKNYLMKSYAKVNAAVPNMARVNQTIKSLNNFKLKDPQDYEQFTNWERALMREAKDQRWPSFIFDPEAPKYTEKVEQEPEQIRLRVEAYKVMLATIDSKLYSKLDKIINGDVHADAQALWRAVQSIWSPKYQYGRYKKSKAAFYSLSMVSTRLPIIEWGNKVMESARTLERLGHAVSFEEIVDVYLTGMLTVFRPYVDKVMDKMAKGKGEYTSMEKIMEYIEARAKKHNQTEIKAKDVKQAAVRYDGYDHEDNEQSKGQKNGKNAKQQKHQSTGMCKYGELCFAKKCQYKHPFNHSFEKAKELVAKKNGGPCGTCKSLWHSTGNHGKMVCRKCKKEGHKESECSSNDKQNATSTKDTRIVEKKKTNKKKPYKQNHSETIVDGLAIPSRQGILIIENKDEEEDDTIISDMMMMMVSPPTVVATTTASSSIANVAPTVAPVLPTSTVAPTSTIISTTTTTSVTSLSSTVATVSRGTNTRPVGWHPPLVLPWSGPSPAPDEFEYYRNANEQIAAAYEEGYVVATVIVHQFYPYVHHTYSLQGREQVLARGQTGPSFVVAHANNQRPVPLPVEERPSSASLEQKRVYDGYLAEMESKLPSMTNRERERHENYCYCEEQEINFKAVFGRCMVCMGPHRLCLCLDGIETPEVSSDAEKDTDVVVRQCNLMRYPVDVVEKRGKSLQWLDAETDTLVNVEDPSVPQTWYPGGEYFCHRCGVERWTPIDDCPCGREPYSQMDDADTDGMTDGDSSDTVPYPSPEQARPSFASDVEMSEDLPEERVRPPGDSDDDEKERMDVSVPISASEPFRTLSTQVWNIFMDLPRDLTANFEEIERQRISQVERGLRCPTCFKTDNDGSCPLCECWMDTGNVWYCRWCRRRRLNMWRFDGRCSDENCEGHRRDNDDEEPPS